MKKLMSIAAVAALGIVATVSSASAEPKNNTPSALACMAKYGFTYQQWRAYAVPPEKAGPYRACRDAAAVGNARAQARRG